MRSFVRYLKEATAPIKHGAVLSDFEKALAPLLGKEVTPEQVAKAAEKLSNKYLYTTDVKKASGLKANQTSIVGFYDIETDRLRNQHNTRTGKSGKKFTAPHTTDMPIELFFIFSTKVKKIAFRPEDIHNLAYGIADALVHETLHMSQAKARNYKKVGSKSKYTYKVDNIEIGSYLAHDDEIEAFALNIALVLKDHFHTQQERFQFLKRPKKGVIADAHLDQYIDVFGLGHPVVKRLLKKIVGYLNNAKL